MQKLICPILLAAGQSKRFGSDKLLYPLSHNYEIKPLILNTLKPWLEVFSVLNIVIREDNAELCQLLNQSECSSQFNLIPAPDAHLGMSASLINGIKATAEADGWLIGLADMPFINSVVIRRSLQALQSGAAITQPEFEGRRGHPVGFSSQFFPELMKLSGDKGGREILEAHTEIITVIESPDRGIHQDIDLK